MYFFYKCSCKKAVAFFLLWKTFFYDKTEVQKILESAMKKTVNGKCIIVGAGDFDEKEIALAAGDYLIAADGGYKSLKQIGQIPHLLVGDFDSLTYEPKNIEILRLDKNKDDTDMLAAIKIGFSKGYKKFELYGSSGSRLDHYVANLTCLNYILLQGGEGKLIDKNSEAVMIRNAKWKFEENYKGFISVLSWGPIAKGVTEKGLKYQLNKADLFDSYPVGVSNDFINCNGYVEVADGTLVIIYQRQKIVNKKKENC